MGGGKGGDKGGGNTTTTIEAPGFARAGLQQAADESQRLFADSASNTFFPGQTFANLNRQQLEGLQGSADLARSGLGGIPQGALGALNQSFLGTDFINDPVVQGQLNAIQSQGNRNFAENLAPNIRRQASQVGQAFGSRGDALQARTAADVQQRISEAQAGFLAQTRGQALDAQGRALALAPQIGNLQNAPNQLLGQVGAQLQNQSQLGINDQINRFNFDRDLQANRVNQLVNQFGSLGQIGGQTTSNVDTDGGNSFSNILGGGALGASLGSMIPGFGAGAGSGIAGALGPGGVALGVGGALLGGLFG